MRPALGRRASRTTPITITSRNRPCFQERVGRVGEVDLDVIGRQRADRERRAGTAGCRPPPRRRSPGRCRRRGAPCCTVTVRDDRRERQREPGRARARPEPSPAGRASSHTDRGAVDRSGHRALRGAVRAAHEGHALLGDARPDGADRARRRDLARRRPARHLDLPARLVRRADEHASPASSCARALQYGPTEGFARVKECIAQVMAAEGMERRHRRAARHHRRPAGDRPRLQDADRPRRRRRSPRRRPTRARCRPSAPTRPTSCRSTMDRDGMRIDQLEATLDELDARRPAAEVHLHDPELPQPGRRDDVAGAPAATGRGSRASASCSCSRTTRTGCCATRATPLPTLRSLDRRVRHLRQHLLEDPLPRRAARLGRRARRRSWRRCNIGKQALRPVLVVDLAVLRRRLLRRRAVGRLRPLAAARSTGGAAT